MTLSEEINLEETNLEKVEIVTNSVPYYKQAEATYYFYINYMSKRISDDSNLVAEEINDEWYFKNVLLIEEEDSLFKRLEIIDPNPKIYYSSSDDSSSESTTATDPLFDPFLPAGITYKESEPKAETLNAFYFKNYRAAITVFEANKAYQEVNNLIMMENILRIVLASSVVFLAFPLFLKNGQTVGKLLFKLGLVTTYGYKVKPLQLLIRYFVFLIVNLVSNIFIPFIFPFISLTVMIFNKRYKSIHDFAANTRVIDLTKSRIYSDATEYANNLKVVSTERRDDFNEEVFSDRFNEDSGA